MENAKKKKVIDIYPPKIKIKSELEQENVSIHIESKEESEIMGPAETTFYEAPFAPKAFHIKKRIIRTKILGSIAFLICFGVFYYLGFIALTKAEIVITPTKLTLSADNSQILIDKNATEINYKQKIIPGNLFVFPETYSQQFQSTGQGKDEERAKEAISIINNFSTSPQILVANTRFEHPSGKIFRLDSRVVIPAATMKDGKLQSSSISANVTADKAGPEYNIPACNSNNNCKFTIPGFQGTEKFQGFYGVSDNPMIGGNFGSVPMITAEDLKNAENHILEVIGNKIGEDLKNKIPENLKILDGAKSSIKIAKLESDASAGDFRQSFTVTAVGEVSVVAFKEQDVVDFIKNQLDNQKPEKYEYCNNPIIEYTNINPDFKNGILRLIISVKQDICHRISTDEIKANIAGKNQRELEVILKGVDGIQKAKAKLFPFWIKKVPNDLNKIKVIIN